jgi:LuxR family maltose regulon positive regulatory protein
LCDAVTGSHDSRGLLEEIDRAQLFVVPLDNARHWYRYLPVFTETLRSQLDRSEPGLAAL